MNVPLMHVVRTLPAPTQLAATVALAGEDTDQKTRLCLLAAATHARVCSSLCKTSSFHCSDIFFDNDTVVFHITVCYRSSSIVQV